MGKCKTKTIQADSGIFMQHIQAYSDIFRHNQAYSRVIKTYSEPCVTLAYSEFWYIQNPGMFKARGIFRTLLYPKLWHIPNQKHIQNSDISETLAHSEPEPYSESWAIQNPQIFRIEGVLRTLSNMYDERFEKELTAIIIFASYYFCYISFSCLLVYKTNMIFLMQV